MTEPVPPIEESATLPNDRDAIDSFQVRLLDAAEKAGYPQAARFAVRLAVEEAIVNAFKHGHAGLDDTVPIEARFRVDTERIFVAVRDQGPGFNPGDVPDPTLDENLERPCGRGLMLMRAYMSDVRHSADGRQVEMTYERAQTEADDEDDD